MSSFSSYAESKPATRLKYLFIKELHFYGVIAAQIIASSILIAMVLWPFLRFPEPQVHLRGMVVEGLEEDDLAKSTLIHYNLTIHNPDRYKSLCYSILVLRITFSKYYTNRGPTVTFQEGGEGVYQGPGDTMFLPPQTFNYTDPDIHWLVKHVKGLKTATKRSIRLWFVLEAKQVVFNKVVVAKRQITFKTRVYFNDAGKAFIDSRRGLLLK